MIAPTGAVRMYTLDVPCKKMFMMVIPIFRDDMTRFGIILMWGPYQKQRWETAYHIADAALRRSDSVTFFLFMDGVYNALATQHFPGVQKVPKDYFQSLMERGAEIYGCEVCTNNRGLQEGEDYLKGIKITGAAIVSSIVETCDRVITL